MLKLVEDNHYHVWTDALHARALSQETNNRWDRGTYVRWTVMTSWIALEIACQEALEEPNISYSFKENLNKAIEQKSLSPIDWGRGVWQKVLALQNLRKNCVHRFSHESALFPEPSVADEAISTVRQAITEIYTHAGKQVPVWVRDDHDRGWSRKGIELFAHGYSPPPGVDENAPDTIRITFTYKDNECTHEILPPNSDPEPVVNHLVSTIGLPISNIRVYKGQEILNEIQFPMDKVRGI